MLSIKTLCAVSVTYFSTPLHGYQNTQCPKQKPGSVHCGYYICSIMSNTGAYRRHPLRVSLNIFTRCIKTSYMVWNTKPKLILLQWKEEKEMKRDPYKDDQHLELVGDLCNFILDPIVHVKGTYHDRESDFGRNPQYQHLRETERLALGR